MGEEHQARLNVLELERRDLQRRNDELMEQIGELREELAVTRNKAQGSVDSSLDPKHFIALRQELEDAKVSSEANRRLAETLENSLAELTRDFETYQQGHNLGLIERNTQLQSESSKQQLRIVELEDLLGRALSEQQRLRDEEAALEKRWAELKELEKRVDQQQAIYADDLSRTKAMLDEVSERYARERNHLNTLGAELETERAQNLKLRTELHSTQEKLQHSEEQERRDSILMKEAEAKVESLETRLKESMSHNELLVKQLEEGALGSSTSDEESVMKHLRRQRDLLHSELDLARQENRRLVLRLEEQESKLNVLLEEERSPKNTAMIAEYQQLLTRLEKYNEVREAGELIRGENERLRVRCDELERDLYDKRSSTEAFQSRLYAMEAEAKLLEEEKKML